MSQSPTHACPRCGRALPDEKSPCPSCLLERALAGGGSAPFVATAAGAAAAGDLPDPAELARHFPRLELGALLGRGASGSVWRARQLELSRDVALKVLAPELSRDPAFQARFEREARALAALDHPNIVRVYDYGTAGPYTYLVMELVDGASLRQLLREGRMGKGEILAFAADICAALAYAHARGVVHRDIKPENLLVDAGGRAKVADFGLAKLVGPGVTPSLRSSGGERVGTPLYMAPEQLEKPASVDHRADLYSLGVVLYELLTGELPIGRFEAPSKRGSPDARLDPVVLRSLEKDPARRQRDAEEVRAELVRAESGAAPPAPAHAAERTSRTALFFSSRFRFVDYFFAGLILVGLNKLPVSDRLRGMLVMFGLLGLVAVVCVAIRALRGTARGYGLQFAACVLGAALALLAGFETDAFLGALLGKPDWIAPSDRYFAWVLCGVAAAGLAMWAVRSSRRALAAFEGRRRWRLWIGSAINALVGVALAYEVLVLDVGLRQLPIPILGLFFVLDVWSGRRDEDLTGPFVRGTAGASGRAVKIELGGKRDIAWIRALRKCTGCTLAQASAARRTSAEWLVATELDDAAARELAGALSAAGVQARVVETEVLAPGSSGAAAAR